MAKIFCDMDGVLVDLLGSIKRHLGTTKLNQGVIDDFFYSDAGTGTEFWAGCGWESGGKQLWKFIKSYKPQILSACPSVCNKDKKVIKGKILWCQDNLGIPKSQVNIVQRKEKQNFAGKDIILIDDHKKNIREWESAGGTGVLHVNTNNTIKQLKGLNLMETTYKEFMEAKVKSWKDMKDRNVLKGADKFKKKMKSGNVLGYTQAHGEFTIFRNDKDWDDAVKHGKDMQWLKVE